MKLQQFSKIFLLFLVLGTAYLCYLIFRPFLVEIIAAIVLVSIFYRPYEWLSKKMWGYKKVSAFIMCLLVVLIVIVPIINLLIYGAQKSIEAYSETANLFSQENIDNLINEHPFKIFAMEKFQLAGIDVDTVKNFVLTTTKTVSNWLGEGVKKAAEGTFGFIFSLIIIIFSMYFFFVDGKTMAKKLMLWTPLPNKYDKEIFKKFRDVSFSVMISTFVTAIIQGILGAIAFVIVGLPAFFAGIFMAILSLFPYVGSALIWFPTAIYLLVIGKITAGIFMLLWGSFVITLADDIIRAHLIKGKAEVHPVFVIFSIFGGLSLFGFWGMILGPLIISLFVTFMHIYELEYAEILEK